MYSVFQSLCTVRNVTVAEVSRATGISQPTFSQWKKGLYTPKRDKLQRIADYFDVSFEYLTTGKDVEKKSTSGKKYYFNDDTAQKAQDLMDNPGLRILFDAAQDAKPEDLQMAADLLKRLKGSDG